MHPEFAINGKAGFAEYTGRESATELLDLGRIAQRSIMNRQDMNCTQYSLDLDEELRFRQYIVNHLEEAIEKEWLQVYYQPIIRAKTNKVCCEEALSRWDDPSRGFLPPNRFIPPLEEEGLMYKLNLAVNPHAQNVPKYISMDNYIRLIEIARKKGDWAGIILMHLMFRYGMRLGECLGLTEEDYIMMRIKGIVVPTLILRNRLSDAPDQKAKRRLTPRSRSDYEGQPYIQQWRNDDYSHINLTESEDTEFVRVFEKFMRDTRERAEALYPKNYRTCEADIVFPADFKGKGLQKNHYIFVNRLGKRLSAQFWGKRLKEYFIEAGIPLDKGKKVNNLSHRFRHGFAMMHARFMDPPVPATELQKMMRHRNLSSTMIYYNPTQEDEYEYKTKMQNKFYDNNEELNGILAGFLSEN